jgi:hypothetical protein
MIREKENFLCDIVGVISRCLNRYVCAVGIKLTYSYVFYSYQFSLQIFIL